MPSDLILRRIGVSAVLLGIVLAALLASAQAL
jgi:uncharacterized protein YjeT (DUF2065 family)